MMQIGSIVLTGGPGAGKTRAVGAVASCWPGRFAVVPEAATQIYRQLRTRWSELDTDGRRDVQKRIYRLQIEQEGRIRELHPGRIVLLDRGTVDGAAYWPEGPDAYWRAMDSGIHVELARYDAVIWLQSTAGLGTYGGSASNPWRSEGPEAASELDERLRGVWASHPRFHCIGAYPKFERKLLEIKGVISGWL